MLHSAPAPLSVPPDSGMWIALLVFSVVASDAGFEGQLPNVWGGAGLGRVGTLSGHLFAYSGADGPTSEGSGFVGVLTPVL